MKTLKTTIEYSPIWSPEQRLFAAVINMAIRDYVGTSVFNKPTAHGAYSFLVDRERLSYFCTPIDFDADACAEVIELSTTSWTKLTELRKTFLAKDVQKHLEVSELRAAMRRLFPDFIPSETYRVQMKKNGSKKYNLVHPWGEMVVGEVEKFYDKGRGMRSRCSTVRSSIRTWLGRHPEAEYKFKAIRKQGCLSVTRVA